MLPRIPLPNEIHDTTKRSEMPRAHIFCFSDNGKINMMLRGNRANFFWECELGVNATSLSTSIVIEKKFRLGESVGARENVVWIRGR